MTWSASAIFAQAMKNPLGRAIDAATAPTGYTSLVADTIKCALYNNTGTPDKNAAVGLTGYNAATSAWVTGNEVNGGGAPWPAGGATMSTGKAWALNTGGAGANVASFDADDAGGAGNVTIANAYGCLIYDDTISGGTVTDQGMCFNYFGGTPQGVSGGTFTVVFDATGIFKVTV